MPKQHVEGYNVHSSYDGNYLPGADFDPDEVFANAGDPEAAGKVQEAMQPAPEPEVAPEVVAEIENSPKQPEPEQVTPGIKITGVE